MSTYIRIVLQIIIIYMFSLLGTLFVQTLHIKFPGSIVGLLLLLITLHLKITPVSLIRDGAGFLLGVLPLFFIPATVGVMKYPELLSVHGLLLILSVIISTILTIGISGRICQYLENKESSKGAV
ncbi:CidA/LrgA family protein [Psychrobacillus vulpis]|uniref:CidA/LrgA family holin-like protein n=1 Tax=Psychrobacillus vulpis TaxID=2325572 RepID=A0A544TS84_9BACI|nr:CidA/LrgA family holin-like protein [Psychrobacillus vulpis]